MKFFAHLQQDWAAFWSVRSEQERKLISGAALLLALALGYSVLIAPAVSGRAKLEKALPELRQQAAQLQALANEAAMLAQRASVPVQPMNHDSLAASLSARGLPTQNLAVTGDYVKLQMTGVPFASLTAWLDALRREHRISVQDAVIVAQAAPGQVDATLTLHQGAGEVR